MKPKSKPSSTFFGTNIIKQFLSEDHPLVQLKTIIDWVSIRNELMTNANGEPINYSHLGRPAWDPLVIFKMLFLQIWHPASDYKVEERATTDLAYRFFLDVPFPKSVPDETTLSRYRSSWGEIKIQQLNKNIISQIQSKGLAKIEPGIVCDITHQLAPIQKPTARMLLLKCFQKFLSELELFANNYPTIIQQKQISPLTIAYKIWYNQYEKEIKEKSLSKEERFSELIQFILKVNKAFSRIINSIPEDIKETLEWESVMVWYNRLQQLISENVVMDENKISQRKKGRKIISLTDPEARAGQKSAKNKFIGHKVAVARTTDGFFLETQTIPGDQNDCPQAPNLLDTVVQFFGTTPEIAGFDKGFDSVENRLHLHSLDIQPAIEFKSMGNPRNPGLFERNDFIIDLTAMTATCPANNTTNSYISIANPDCYKFQFLSEWCSSCILRSNCTTNKTGRTIQISHYSEMLEHDNIFLQTNEYKEIRKCRWGLEGDFGWAKKYHQLNKTRYLGLKKSGFYNRMIFLVLNVKRLLKHTRSRNNLPLEGERARGPSTS